jgi:FkbM family methyltransferase
MAGASGVIRRLIDRYPAVRCIVKSRLLQVILQTWRASRSLSPRAAFIVRQLKGTPTVSRYRLGGQQISLHLRHRTRDVDIFNEVFGGMGGRCGYEAPAPIAESLRSKPIDVLDLGGNIGLFALYAFTQWNVRSLTSYEPDPWNASILRMTIAANQLSWHIEEAAVSNRGGTLRFVPGLFSEGRAAEQDEDAIDVRMVDFFEIVAGMQLVKIDIEGSEWPILGDPRLGTLQAEAVVMEWHGRDSPRGARRAAIDAFENSGYRLARDDPSPSLANGLIWMYR